MTDTTSIILIIAIVVSIVIVLSPYVLRFWKSSSEIQTTVTTMGIVGTFSGILVSLSNFDVDNISTTIPQLINGLQLAFVTSVAGISTALLTSLFPRIYLIKKEEAEEALTDSELLSAMHKELVQLNSNIAGDNESTLITQIQKLRTSVTDKQDELKKSFDQFAEGMVNSNIDALAEAIEKVMGEFNTTVNEKLGKTFEDFRAAVENLNHWQSEYKGQIDSQTENMKTVQDSMAVVTQSMDGVNQSLAELVTIKEKFDAMLEQLNAQLQGSVDFASSMKDLSSEIEGSGKMIREELNEITRGAADEMEKTINKTLADFGSSLASISGRMADDFERIQQMLENSSGN